MIAAKYLGRIRILLITAHLATMGSSLHHGRNFPKPQVHLSSSFESGAFRCTNPCYMYNFDVMDRVRMLGWSLGLHIA